MQMKGYADNKRYVKPKKQVGDSVLVPKEAINKATPSYEAEPLRVQCRKGAGVVAKRPDGSSITRTTVHFKKVPYGLINKAHRWTGGQQSLSMSHHQAPEKMGPLVWSRLMEA